MNEEEFMNLALRLAKKANPFPNPRVGCVIVKNQKVIGKGYHKAKGLPHAEQEAIRTAIEKGYEKLLNGAVLYTTLEPCTFFHNKKTPSCVDLILKHGIKKVVIATVDPNPDIRGIEELTKNGVEVETGLMENKASQLIEEFKTYIKYKRPLVHLKAAVSIDGKMALDDGRSKWITSEALRKLNNINRTKFQGILVGINTVIKDDPLLNVREKKVLKQPTLIVLDTNLKIDVSARVLSEELRKTRKTIIFHSPNALKSKMKLLQKLDNVFLEEVNQTTNGLDITKILNIISEKYYIGSLLVEGGSSVISSFIESDHFDYLTIEIGNKLLGGNKNIICKNQLTDSIDNSMKLKLLKVKKIEDELLITYANPKKN